MAVPLPRENAGVLASLTKEALDSTLRNQDIQNARFQQATENIDRQGQLRIAENAEIRKGIQSISSGGISELDIAKFELQKRTADQLSQIRGRAEERAIITGQRTAREDELDIAKKQREALRDAQQQRINEDALRRFGFLGGDTTQTPSPAQPESIAPQAGPPVPSGDLTLAPIAPLDAPAESEIPLSPEPVEPSAQLNLEDGGDPRPTRQDDADTVAGKIGLPSFQTEGSAIGQPSQTDIPFPDAALFPRQQEEAEAKLVVDAETDTAIQPSITDEQFQTPSDQNQVVIDDLNSAGLKSNPVITPKYVEYPQRIIAEGGSFQSARTQWEINRKLADEKLKQARDVDSQAGLLTGQAKIIVENIALNLADEARSMTTRNIAPVRSPKDTERRPTLEVANLITGFLAARSAAGSEDKMTPFEAPGGRTGQTFDPAATRKVIEISGFGDLLDEPDTSPGLPLGADGSIRGLPNKSGATIIGDRIRKNTSRNK